MLRAFSGYIFGAVPRNNWSLKGAGGFVAVHKVISAEPYAPGPTLREIFKGGISDPDFLSWSFFCHWWRPSAAFRRKFGLSPRVAFHDGSSMAVSTVRLVPKPKMAGMEFDVADEEMASMINHTCL